MRSHGLNLASATRAPGALVALALMNDLVGWLLSVFITIAASPPLCSHPSFISPFWTRLSESQGLC